MERNNKLRFYNTINWSAEDRIFFNNYSGCMAIDNIDQNIALGFENSMTKIYNYQSGNYVQDIPGSFRTSALKYSIDNGKLCFSPNGSLKIFDFNSNTIINQLDNLGDVYDFDVTDDLDLVIFSGNNDGISFWNTQKNKSHKVLFGIGYDKFRKVDISPDNTTLFAWEIHGSYVLCDIEYRWIQDMN
jgi:hypothetical protein